LSRSQGSVPVQTHGVPKDNTHCCRAVTHLQHHLQRERAECVHRCVSLVVSITVCVCVCHCYLIRTFTLPVWFAKIHQVSPVDDAYDKEPFDYTPNAMATREKFFPDLTDRHPGTHSCTHSCTHTRVLCYKNLKWRMLSGFSRVASTRYEGPGPGEAYIMKTGWDRELTPVEPHIIA
jgi:hypothetical protein